MQIMCFRVQSISWWKSRSLYTLCANGRHRGGLEWAKWLLAVDKVMSIKSNIAGKVIVGQSHHKMDWVMARCGQMWLIKTPDWHFCMISVRAAFMTLLHKAKLEIPYFQYPYSVLSSLVGNLCEILMETGVNFSHWISKLGSWDS